MPWPTTRAIGSAKKSPSTIGISLSENEWAWRLNEKCTTVRSAR